MDILQDLLHWAKDKGVELNGIKLRRVPGRGTGVIATRKLKSGETILTVPLEALRSLDSISISVSRKLPSDVPFHALLAMDLMLDKSNDFMHWKAVLPTQADFEATTPCLWPKELQILLPGPAQDNLKKQQDKFQREWKIVAKAFPGIHQSEYLYSWLIVNTRTFSYVTPDMEGFAYEDRLALVPITDLFNHEDSGCEVSFSPKSFIITADRMYQAGDEVHICYGSHSNDFLLTEYGFVLTKNKWDEVCLDDMILPLLDATQRIQLDNRGYLGNYTIDDKMEACHRTQVVLRILCCTPKQWNSFVDGEDNGQTSQGTVDAMLAQLLDRFLVTIRKNLENIEKLKVGHIVQRELISQRWKQIEILVMQAVERLHT